MYKSKHNFTGSLEMTKHNRKTTSIHIFVKNNGVFFCQTENKDTFYTSVFLKLYANLIKVTFLDIEVHVHKFRLFDDVQYEVF